MEAPKVLGLYRLSRELSRGGMGAVYEATHSTTGARYAIKVILGNRGGSNPTLTARFRREAEALAQLNHPHVVRIHGAELDGVVPYLVQDLLLGGTLEDRLIHGRLPVEEAIALTVKLASGLASAHTHGILHRDLKPENVMFDDRGEPVLVDFGIARMLAGSQRLTQTGELIGTPCYMSPEQANGKPCDARADVYGLGALFYSMLTAQPPTPSQSSLLVTLAAVANAPVESPRTFGVELSSELEAVCMRALAKKPDERYPSAQAFSEALLGAGSDTRRSSRLPALGAATFLVALTAIALAAGVHAKRSATPRAPLEISQAPTEPAAPLGASSPQRLRSRARAALRKGDVAAAISASQLARSLGHDDTAWRRLRGLTQLLSGESEAAKAALRGTPAVVLCDAESLRRSLDRQARQGLSVLDTPANVAHLEGLSELVASADTWHDLDPVGPLLVSRSQTTIASSILRLGSAFTAGHRVEITELLRKARDMGPDQPGAGAVGVSWSYVIFESSREEVVWQEIRGHLSRALSHDDLEDSWRRRGGLLMAAITEGSLLKLDDLPPSSEESPTHLERRVVETGCRLLADRWYPKLVDAMLERRPRAAAEAWRNTRRFSEERRRISRPRSLGRTVARLNLAGLLLLALRPDEALERLNEGPIKANYHPELDFLRAEAQLLTESALEPAETRMTALARRQPKNPYLVCLVAAIKFARRNNIGGFAGLALVNESSETNQSFNPILRAPFWRTVEQTKLEAESKPGQRAFLADALRRWP